MKPVTCPHCGTKFTPERRQRITQKYLAQQIGINYNLFNQYYRGRQAPKWQTAKKIADVLGLDPVEVVEDCSAALRKVLGKEEATTCQEETDGTESHG